jgi:UDP-GlcNAc:undecaprenyl-phosphate GlcNAc-1-phosphate transferase
VREYLLTAVIAAAVTYLLTPLVRVLAVRLGAMAPIRARDVHLEPTPRWGGIAMLGGMLVALLVAYHLPLLHHAFQNGRDVIAIASGAILITLLGIADDIWQLDALTKLAGQALAAAVMVSQGVQLLWLPIHGILALPPVVGPFLTVLVVLIAINAVNFVDGLDGLAAGIVAISASSFFAYSYLLAVVHGFSRANAATLITSILVGICIGFLPHNVSPARIFMGDSGAMLLGLLLASAVISLTGGLDANGLSAENLAPALLPLLLPIAILAIPLIDMGWAIIRRTSKGRSPFAPDKAHLHHRLLNIGHSQKQAAFVLYLWTAAIAFPFSAAAFLPLKWAVLAGLCALALATVVTLKAVARRPGVRV